MFLEFIPANTEDELRLNSKRLYILYILNMNTLIIALLFNFLLENCCLVNSYKTETVEKDRKI